MSDVQTLAKGTRVVFEGFGEPDPYSRLAIGTEGTVTFVDSLGTVFVDWDDGSRIGLVGHLGGGRPDRFSVLGMGES